MSFETNSNNNENNNNENNNNNNNNSISNHIRNPRKTTEDLTTNFICCICMEHNNFYSLGLCDHICTCLKCILKFRTFYNNLNCPICHLKSEIIFICPISESHCFNDLKSKEKFFYKDDDFKLNGIYYTEISSREESLKIKNFNCPVEKCISNEKNFDNILKLKKHLENVHNLFYCEVCLNEGKKFLSEQKVFKKEDLLNHKKFGDIENEIPPHFQCKFCKYIWCFNTDSFYSHMEKNHFLCEICKKNSNENIFFFSKIDVLIKHNELKHYCCPFKECKEEIYIAFGKESEFKQHLINKHNLGEIGPVLTKTINENLPKEQYGNKIDIEVQNDLFDFKTFVDDIYKKYLNRRIEYFKNINENLTK